MIAFASPAFPTEGPLQITAIAYDPNARELDLTFTSTPGDEYVIEGSPDLRDWSEELAGSIIGSVGPTTEVNDLPLEPPNRDTLFVRVRRLPPFIETVPVGNPGNDDDLTGFDGPIGAVDYAFRIGKFEVTNAQYAEFLNAVAAADPNALYDPGMDTSAEGGITRSGESPGFRYDVKAGMENRPAILVSWYDCLRFCNWLHNGRPAGTQAADTTEDGAYTLTGPTSVATGSDPVHGANGRNSGARFHLPSRDEWHKAAYHEPGASGDGYWRYPTRSDEDPVLEPPPGGGNSANYDTIVGTVTAVGSYANSVSFYGTLDQGGNVHEWTEQASEAFPESRELRGGAWFFDSGGLQATFRDIGSPEAGSAGTGFRVAGPERAPDRAD